MACAHSEVLYTLDPDNKKAASRAYSKARYSVTPDKLLELTLKLDIVLPLTSKGCFSSLL